MQNKTIIEDLAKTYGQLYVVPGPGAKEKYIEIVENGSEPEAYDLSHFITSEKDSISVEETPAGGVTVITLVNRQDFVTFLRCMAYQCEPVDIPDTQGASIIDGVINWRKIERHMEDYRGSDLDAEFERFTSDKRNFKDVLIVLSIGPYSAVPADKLGLSDEEWITLSGTIRKYHECTHFICRKLYPDKKDPIWDELVADAVGTVAAFGDFDDKRLELFLGIEDGRYVHGRLENYTDVDADLIDKIAKTLEHFRKIIEKHPDAGPYELAVMLEEEKDIIWKLCF